MIYTSKKAAELTKEHSIETLMPIINQLIESAIKGGKENVLINEGYINSYTKEILVSNGYQIGCVNNGIISISWLKTTTSNGK